MKIFTTVLAFCLVTIPSFAQQKIFDITNYGAVGDAKSVATKQVQSAIDACNAAGGGKVLVPTGTFVIGTVHLKSNVHLYLDAGAVLKGSANLDDYETYIPDKPFSPVHKGMLFTEDAENVTISGEGQIDGNGDVFFDLSSAKRIDAEGTRLTRQRDNFRHVESGIGDGPVVPKDRPYQMFVFSNCKRVTVKDIYVTKAPFWCMHFADCDAVKVDGIRLWNSLLAPNADGIDVTSCTNVIISNCDIRAGDDAIAITGYDHHFEIPGYRKTSSLPVVIYNRPPVLFVLAGKIRIPYAICSSAISISPTLREELAFLLEMKVQWKTSASIIFTSKQNYVPVIGGAMVSPFISLP